MYLIALRNQGRLREAMLLHATGSLPGLPKPAVRRGTDGYNDAILAFERGNARAAADAFGRIAHRDVSRLSPGVQARERAWHSTLQGMALGALGDTAGVRALADTVEQWGRGSMFGRDRRAHHYLRGLVLAAAGRHEDAVKQYREAVFSPSLGFTRVNYELGRSLMALGRPADAVAALQPALRGEVDAANLYVTRTDLHELLAQAFAAAGVRDSAAFHYRAVVKAWDRADPAFHGRRAAARDWLARNPR
jgi:predicted Zn-dependent protease